MYQILRKLVAKGHTDFWMVPRFADGYDLQLRYFQGSLDTSELGHQSLLMLNQSRVPRRLASKGRALAGLELLRCLYVDGQVVTYGGETRFIARSSCRDAERGPECPTPLVLQLLASSGMLTALPLCSWLCVTGQKPDGSARCRPPPRSEAEYDAWVNTRIGLVQAALIGRSEFWWKPPKTLPPRRPRALPVSRVIGLEPFWSASG